MLVMSVQSRSPARPKETGLSYKDCLLSGSTNKSPSRSGRGSPMIMEPSMSAKTQEDGIQSLERTLENGPNNIPSPIAGRIQGANKQIDELIAHNAALEEGNKEVFAKLHQLLEEKEKAAVNTYRIVCSSKLKILTKYRDSLRDFDTDNSDTSSPPEAPVLYGDLHCGFVPDVTSVIHSTASLVMEHRELLGEGDQSKANVIGSMNTKGVFWVRILPDENNIQDIMLLNLSNTISVELSLSPPPFLRPSEVKVGDLCCALYTSDQRWYRAQIINLLERNQVKVFFMDYGNTETMTVTNLYPLHPKFLVYPFQMIQCCFSVSQDLVYEREVRWEFNDLTHGHQLMVKILELLPQYEKNRFHLVELLNQSRLEAGQPTDVGKRITELALPAKKKQQRGANIQYHDVRYASKGSIQQQIVINTPVPSGASTATPLTTSSPATDQEGKQSDVEIEEQLKKKEEDIDLSSDGYFTQSSDGAVNNSASSDAIQLPFTKEAAPPMIHKESSDSDVPACEAENAVNHDASISESPRASEVLPGAQVVGTTDDPGLLSSSRVYGRSASPHTHFTTFTGEGKHEQSRATREVRSVPPSLEPSEPRAKVAGFNRVTACDSNQVVLKKGQKYDMFVTTPLQKDGTFWLQMASTEEPPFQKMVDKLQSRCRDEPPTPIFLSPGQCCVAQFSEDGFWYRAKIENIVKYKFKVRYLDFGNCELLEQESLVKLASEFMTIPFQAAECSIACDNRTSFTDKEIEKFNSLTESQKLQVQVLSAEPNHPVSVELYFTVSSGTVVNVNEEVFSADFKMAESLTFSKKEAGQDSQDGLIESLGSLNKLTSTSNWADCMDEIQSPTNDGVFTIAGHEGSKSPRGHLSPAPPSYPSPRNTPSPKNIPLAAPSTGTGPRSMPRTIPSSSNSPHRVSDSNATPSPPRIALTRGATASPTLQRRNIVPPSPPTGTSPTAATCGATYSATLQQGSASTSPVPPNPLRKAASPVPPNPLRKAASPVPPNPLRKAEKAGKTTVSSTSPHNGSSSATTTPRSTSAPRINANALYMVRKNLPTPDNNKLKPKDSDSTNTGALQPKGMRSINQAARNGTAFPPGRRRKSPDPDSTQIMDKEGGMRAVKGLDGYHLSGSPKPLSVQPYKGTTEPSPHQAELDNLSHQSCTRLFVKNIPVDRTPDQMKDMFSQYGTVIGLVPIPSRKNVVYMYMEPKGAQVAIDNLHGKAISKCSKPMIVELSNPPRSSRT